MSRLARNPNFGKVAGGVDPLRAIFAAARRSGSLKLSNRQLQQVPPMMERFTEETYVDISNWNLQTTHELTPLLAV